MALIKKKTRKKLQRFIQQYGNTIAIGFLVNLLAEVTVRYISQPGQNPEVMAKRQHLADTTSTRPPAKEQPT